MSLSKILIDFSEYERLVQIEKNYEKLRNEKQEGAGEHDLSNIILEKEKKDALIVPLPSESKSITMPASSLTEPPTVEKNVQKTEPKKSRYISDKWYEIGPPPKKK